MFGERSVSTKKPPSMCGIRWRVLIKDWIWGESCSVVSALKKGLIDEGSGSVRVFDGDIVSVEASVCTCQEVLFC